MYRHIYILSVLVLKIERANIVPLEISSVDLYESCRKNKGC